jgi:hypothetical protein
MLIGLIASQSGLARRLAFRQDLLDLARTWTQAALLERQSLGHDSPPEVAAA